MFDDSSSMYAYLIAGAIALAVTFALIPWLIRSVVAHGMVGKDRNKVGEPEIAEMGGVAVVSGFFVGVVALMVMDAVSTAQLIPNPTLLLAALIAVLGAAFVGAIDDLFELRQRVKAVLPIVFGIPLGAYYTDTAIHLPQGAAIELGLLMVPVIAFMVSAGANAANMLEGFNGLGAGLGLIMAATFTALSIYSGRPEALLLLAPFIGASLAFLYFNKFPAKVFPGDTFTLFMGATIVAAAVLTDLKEVGALLFIPLIIEFILKARNRFQAETYGTPDPSGRIVYHGPIGSLTHVAMRAGAKTEKGVVAVLWSVEAGIAAVVLAFIFI